MLVILEEELEQLEQLVSAESKGPLTDEPKEPSPLVLKQEHWAGSSAQAGA